jgi:plasmid maintenance system killer protein
MYSIRINAQFRVVFELAGSDARNVQIMDYH